VAIERQPTQQDASWFLELYRQEKLNLNPSYQRRSVWTRKDKQFFLDTILNNYPCPAIYIQKEITEDYETIYNVVDGKQRITTIIEFYNNKIRLGDDLGDENLNGKLWKDIYNDTIKRRFISYRFSVDILDSIDNEGWNKVFDRLNRNSKTLTNQELRHARFDGWLINRAEQEAVNPIWKDLKISSAAKARRMKDVEFISILMLVILEEKIVGFPQSALDKLYEKYEIEAEGSEEEFFEEKQFEGSNEGIEKDDQILFDEQISEYIVPQTDIESFEEKFLIIKSFLEDIIFKTDILSDNKVFGAKRTTHIYTLWTYLSLIEVPDDINSFITKYEKFFEIFETLKNTETSNWPDVSAKFAGVNHVIKYFENSVGPTTEEPQRRARLDALKNYLSDH